MVVFMSELTRVSKSRVVWTVTCILEKSAIFGRKLMKFYHYLVGLFSGTEKMDAVAVRNRFKAGVEAGKLGEFVIIYDYSKVLDNKSQDALFKLVLSVSF